MKSRFSLVLFDVDGTLLKPNTLSQECFEQTLLQILGIKVDIGTFPMSGKTDPQIMKELMLIQGISPNDNSKLNQALSIYVNLFLSSLSNVKLEACIGVSETLDLFKQAEIRSLGLITGNMQELVAPKLQSASLPANMFIVGAYGSDHENRNRLPEIATMRAKHIFGKSFPPATVLIVGDTPLDIGCARYFGSKVLAVSTGIYSISELEKHKPDYLMKDLSNHKLLKELFLDEK